MSRPSDEPAREMSRWAGLRDVLAGLAILALGLWTGGSSVASDRDGVDVAFDVLGGVWLAWGLFRLVRGSRSSGAPRSPERPESPESPERRKRPESPQSPGSSGPST